MRVLIVDDEAILNSTIRKILINQNYSVDCAYDGKSGLRKALSNEYDIILLDIMMPQMNGYDVLKHLRGAGRETPVMMITAKDDITDKVDGLDLGADDYLQKPFNMNELTARMRALTRREHKSENQGVIYYADIILNLPLLKLSRGSLQIILSLHECKIIEFFIRHSEIIVSLEKISQNCNVVQEKVISVIEKLQKVLKTMGSRVKIIYIRGVGYKICC